MYLQIAQAVATSVAPTVEGALPPPEAGAEAEATEAPVPKRRKSLLGSVTALQTSADTDTDADAATEPLL